jgi:hypothetical protein
MWIELWQKKKFLQQQTNSRLMKMRYNNQKFIALCSSRLFVFFSSLSLLASVWHSRGLYFFHLFVFCRWHIRKLWIIQSVIKQLFKLKMKKISHRLVKLKRVLREPWKKEDEVRIYGFKCSMLIWGEESVKLGSSRWRAVGFFSFRFTIYCIPWSERT